LRGKLVHFHLNPLQSPREPLVTKSTINDDLQRVLAKHDAIAAAIAVRVERKQKIKVFASTCRDRGFGLYRNPKEVFDDLVFSK
jgi:hypothetical protein